MEKLNSHIYTHTIRWSSPAGGPRTSYFKQCFSKSQLEAIIII